MVTQRVGGMQEKRRVTSRTRLYDIKISFVSFAAITYQGLPVYLEGLGICYTGNTRI